MIPGFPVLNCVDMSKWGGELTDAEAECMVARGIRLVIVATGPGGYGERGYQQAETALRHGMLVDGYSFLEFESAARWWAEDAVRDLDGLPVRRWWVDIEDTVNGRHWTPEQRCDYADEMFDTFDREAGRANVGIYDAAWFHVPYLGNTKRWASRALWDANYPYGATVDSPVISLWAGREYGGFSEPEIYQFKGTTELCGQSVDLNWARVLEDEMDNETRAELMAIKRRLARIENDGPTADVPDPWLVPRLAELERKHEALNATVTPLVRDVARLAGQHSNGHPSSGLAPGVTFRATVE